MSIRIATYNFNNLFTRAKLLQAEGMSAESAAVLEDVQQLSNLIAQDSYEGEVGDKIIELLTKYNFHKNGNEYFTINEIKGKLFSKKRDGTLVLRAKGRQDWVGGVRLASELVDGTSTINTGRVIAAAKPDVLCAVEVEDRSALEEFNQTVLGSLGFEFPHEMEVEGNDKRGINVGLCCKYEIRSIRSHVDDEYTTAGGKQEKIFSRDCAEYEVVLPDGESLWVLCNHLKSQGYGTTASNDAKRARQAERVHQLLSRFDLEKDLVAVVGDFNANVTSHSLDALLQTPNLIDVLQWEHYTEPRWTYEDGKSQLDYLLVSKALFNKLEEVGIERRGIFKRNNLHFPEVTSKVTQASDHALVWAQFAI